jgi:hypothetical protein
VPFLASESGNTPIRVNPSLFCSQKKEPCCALIMSTVQTSHLEVVNTGQRRSHREIEENTQAANK